MDPGCIDQEFQPPRSSELPDCIEVLDISVAIVSLGAEDQRFGLQDG